MDVICHRNLKPEAGGSGGGTAGGRWRHYLSFVEKKGNNKKMKALQVNCFAWGIEGTGPNFYFNL
ncbi:hypothetical protein Hanom_Chr08g00692491 [Helianthus anomalus]